MARKNKTAEAAEQLLAEHADANPPEATGMSIPVYADDLAPTPAKVDRTAQLAAMAATAPVERKSSKLVWLLGTGEYVAWSGPTVKNQGQVAGATRYHQAANLLRSFAAQATEGSKLTLNVRWDVANVLLGLDQPENKQYSRDDIAGVTALVIAAGEIEAKGITLEVQHRSVKQLADFRDKHIVAA